MHTPRISLRLIAVAAALVVSTASHAAPDAAFTNAVAQFKLATTGDAQAIDQAAEQFSTLLQQTPDNPVLMTYAGSSLSMRAITAPSNEQRRAYAEDGLAMIDKALIMLTPAHDQVGPSGVPDALQARYVAARTFLAVPAFMNRRPQGVELINTIVSSPQFAQCPAGFQDAVQKTLSQVPRAQK